jgi:hypothetical protein
MAHVGAIYTFDLGGRTETVLVTAFAEPSCQSGTATVEGTFEAVKRGVICLLDAVDPRASKGK